MTAQRDQLRAQQSLNDQKVIVVQLVNSVKSENLPLEELTYQLNLLDIEDMYLSDILIQDNILKIEGYILNSNSQWLLTKYIDTLKQFSYISDLSLEIKDMAADYSMFVIKSKISGRTKKAVDK